MIILGANWKLSSWNTHSLKFLKKLWPSPKLLVGEYFKDRILKDKIIFWSYPNSFNDNFQRVRLFS